jgi:acetyltransferase-like isoleucine patch superfamily enzyme
MTILNADSISLLKSNGLDTYAQPGNHMACESFIFEPPCSVKWMNINAGVSLGAFSYGVSGFYTEVQIGRYCSLGEQIQIGRGNHPMDFLSTSPIFYSKERLFNVGTEFNGGDDYKKHIPQSIPNGKISGNPLKTIVGNDVWIGHAAFIKPGIIIGNGAVIAAHSVVTKNVPAYAVVGGNPAKVLKMRFDDVMINKLEATKWWEYAPWQMSSAEFSNPELCLEVIADLRENTPPFKPGFFKLNSDGNIVPANANHETSSATSRTQNAKHRSAADKLASERKHEEALEFYKKSISDNEAGLIYSYLNAACVAHAISDSQQTNAFLSQAVKYKQDDLAYFNKITEQLSRENQ